MHNPGPILERAGATVDFARPVGVMMMLGILNFVLDFDKARDIVRQVMAQAPSGSFLVLAHPTFGSEFGGKGQIPAMKFWNENATPPYRPQQRRLRRVLRVARPARTPGLVSCSQWRAEDGIRRRGAAVRRGGRETMTHSRAGSGRNEPARGAEFVEETVRPPFPALSREGVPVMSGGPWR
ncbi:SAM-dependent methyltransferase [Streptomyces sviceus]|uniref:SAM-dependent methyltransferase n=1 Tax=Streptomyces sviceus TaxID=285530 RepID=UPI0036F124A7